MAITDRLTSAVSDALEAAGLPGVAECAWEPPKQAGHGDYATNVAMVLARGARRSPRQVAELILANLPALPEVDRVEVAGPGFLNVFLSPVWCARQIPGILAEGEAYGTAASLRGDRIRVEFVSANPTGPLVIVNARAAAVGDALARILRSQGADVAAEYYINDAGTQAEALARSFRARVRELLNDRHPGAPLLDARLPENGYPGEYLIDLARGYLEGGGTLGAEAEPAELERLGRYAVDQIVDEQRRVLETYGVAFDLWTSERRDVRDAGLPERALEELSKRELTYEGEGALWFRSTAFGDDKDRVLRRSNGELTYFAVDVAYHHYRKFGGADRVINLMGPDHHGYVGRMQAAMQALGNPAAAFEVLIVQLVTLLREGQPVRMSKRRGEFVLMEELLEEVGRDAARFTFLTRRHDSPLDFDLAVAARQTSDNPVYYVQYAHARICSIARQAREQGIAVSDWDRVDTARLTLGEEQQLIKRLLQYPEAVAAAARAREPHRLAYWLQEVAGLFHPYYRAHRVIQDDRVLTEARLALCAAVGRVVANGLGLLGVSAPESM
ncbi:MAG TPA: arginine--tRNA ligase [Vicinamibacteria bacterium]|nr:arginine--tRNA ligase [Vicinamibacteria bacterium]